MAPPQGTRRGRQSRDRYRAGQLVGTEGRALILDARRRTSVRRRQAVAAPRAAMPSPMSASVEGSVTVVVELQGAAEQTYALSLPVPFGTVPWKRTTTFE